MAETVTCPPPNWACTDNWRQKESQAETKHGLAWKWIYWPDSSHFRCLADALQGENSILSSPRVPKFKQTCIQVLKIILLIFIYVSPVTGIQSDSRDRASCLLFCISTYPWARYWAPSCLWWVCECWIKSTLKGHLIKLIVRKHFKCWNKVEKHYKCTSPFTILPYHHAKKCSSGYSGNT